MRENTERPVTVTIGTNYLVGTSPDKITQSVDTILRGQGKKGAVPKYWDGKAGDRIVATLASVCGKEAF
jgi:UDP-N-acetylglucosamine 2-epimerase (non-hydrolysing)